MNWYVEVKEKTASVMDDLKRTPVPHEESFHVVLALMQESGRGRLGRLWKSPKGGLYAGILLKPKFASRDIAKITLLMAVVLCEVFREHLAIYAQIKWPNDLLVEGKKAAGILTEAQITGQTIDRLVIGIGINVNNDAGDLPEHAVSLKQLSGKEYDIKNLLDLVLERLTLRYQEAVRYGFADALNRWRELNGIIGSSVRIERNNQMVGGTAIDIDDQGALLVRTEKGEIVRVSGGETDQI